MSDNTMNITAERDGDDIVIRMPLELLVRAAEHNPDEPLYIQDVDQFANYVIDNIFEFDEDEAGNSRFERLIDRLTWAAYEDGLPIASYWDVQEQDVED